ncbi:T9SS type B sorting domain-containing protein [Geofilum rhodophaeum]|uniref:T9SS type B sorting domain-containing protein n=1 Tax=Geofilum rhodophaeum TaxID=1965019 RepID=UPI0011BAE0CE|nr:gliding motility-associated C-terminal domain-containing protein [Geofilum rhodophaeum]
MIDRYLLRIVVVLLLAVLPLAVFAQVDYPLDLPESEYVEMTERIKMANGFFLKGGSGDLSSVPVTYCSEGGYFDVVPSAWLPEADGLAVEVYSTLGGEQVLQTGWGEIIGSGQASVYRFYPDLVEEEFYGSRIYFYVFQTEFDGEIDVRITIESDYTRIFESPTEFELTRLDPDQCAGNTVTLQLSGSEPFVEYQLERGGTAVGLPLSGNGSPLTFAADQTGTYTVTAISQIQTICETPMDGAIEVEIFPLPDPTASSDASAYCEGDPIQLSGGPDDMVNYSWAYPDGTIVEERNPLIASADYGSHNGTYTLTVESADGCINSTTLDVEVNENPVATLPADFDVCEDAPLNFTATVTGGAGSYSYAWTKEGSPIGTATASISVPNASLGDAGVYEVTVTDANGCGAATASISIGVNERPVIGAVSNDGPACEGESIQLSSSGVTGVGILSYAWTGPNGYSSSDENPLIDPVTSADAGVYTLVVSDESGCSSDPATTTVVVDALPEATLSGDAAVCVGATGSYTAGGGDQYTFTVLDASNTTVESQGPSASNTFETSALAVGSYTINVLVENAAGCTAEESVTLTVNAAPEATIAFDPAVICEGEGSELVVELTTGAAPWSFSYNDGSGLVSRSGISGLTHREEVNHTSNVTYTLLSITDANGCTVNPNTTAALTVNERPSVSVKSDNDPSNEVCLDGTMDLTATASDGIAPYGYQWYFEGNPISGATGATYTISNAEAADAGAYSVVVSSSNAGVTCDSDPASLTVTVVEVTAALDGAAGYCLGGTETYTASGGDSYTFTLYDAGNNVIATQATSVNDSYTTSAALTAGDYTLEVEVANALGCGDVATLPFTIYPEPVASISFSESVVCEGDNTTLEIELTSGSTPWSVTYNNGVGDQTVNGITETSFSLEFSPTGDVTYTLVSITDANGCTATPGTTAEVTVNEVPTVGLLSDNDPSNLVCLGNDMLLTATASGGAGNYVYQWTHNGVVIPGVTGATYTISNAEAGDAGEYSVVVTDTDNGHACESAPASLIVVVTEAVADLSGSGEICAGTSEEYTATGGSSYLFELLDAADAVIDTRAWDSDATYSTDLALAVGTYTLRVTVEDANGCQAQSELPIEVKGSPDNTLTYSATDICSGESITLAAQSGYSTYIFYVNGDEVQNGTDHEYTSNTFVDGDVVKAEIILGACSTESAEQTITVRPLPVVELVSDQPDNVACPGETVLLTASGADQYAFEVNGVQVQAPGATATYSAVFADGDQIIVYGEAANACVASDTLTISVNTPVATLALSSSELCVNEPLTLTAGGGVQYEFFRNGVSLGVAGSASTFEVSDPADADVFSVSVVNEYDCVASEVAAAIVVHDLPTATLNSDQTVFCHGTEVTFTAEGGDAYAFYRIRGGVEELVQEGSSATYSATDFEDGDQVYVEVSDANSCAAASASITLTVRPLPEAGITVAPQYAGEGDDVTISGSGGDDYLFLVNGEPYDGDLNGWITGPIVLTTLQNGDELSVTARNEFGCTDNSEVVTMTIDTYPIEFDLLPVYSEYCENDGGATLYLEEHEPLTNVEYDLFEVNEANELIGPAGITPIEDGDFLIWTGVTEGSYKVVARRLPGGLEKEFAAVAEVKMNSNPTVFDLVAVENTTICEVSISLSGSETGVYYYLQLDGSPLVEDPIEGNGSSLDFGTFSFGGTYSILAVSLNGCSTEMNNPYLKEVTPNSALFTVSSDPVDGSYCEGSEGVIIQTDGSEDGAAYQVYYNGASLGEGVNGTGTPLSFGPYTNEGTYRVVIAGAGGCLYVLDDAITVSEIALPDPVALSAENEGHFCEGDTEGVALTQTGFQADVNYALYYNGALVTGSEWTASSTDMSGSYSYGDFSQAGTYTIQGTTIGGGCSQQVAEIELVADALPTVFELSGDDFYCGPDGQTILALSGSQSDVEYTLYRDDVPVATQSGNGGLLNFIVDQEGEYRVEAVYIHEHTSCPLAMNGIIQVDERPLPDLTKLVNVDVSTADCTTGAEVTLLASEPGVEYEIYWWADEDNNGPTGSILSGDGSDLVFSAAIIDGGGSYRVQAIMNGCPEFLDEIFTVDIPNVLERFNITGEGTVCEGDGGVEVGLSGSEADVTYSLLDRDLGSVVGSPINTAELVGYTAGDALSFGIIEEAGNYIVEAVSNDGTCILEMNGDFELRFNPLPIAFQLTGSGVFCDAGSGAAIGLDDSEENVLYTLIWDDAGVPRTRGTAIGSGEALYFAGVSDEGDYTVYARNTLTGCTSSMNGTVEVEQRPAPSEALTITANDYCSDGSTGELTVAGHETDVFYHLYSPDASGSLIQTLVGTGGTEDLVFEGLQEGNLYTLYASWEDEACMVALSSDISVSLLDSPEVPVLDPIVENPTCAGEAFISVTNAQEGVVYTLINEELGTQFEINDEPVLWDYTFLENEGLLSSFLQVVAVHETTGCRVGSDLFRIEVLDAPGDFVLESNGTPVTRDVPVVKCSNSPFDLRIPVSEDGVLYRLYRRSASGGVDRLATLEGNGAEISFSNINQWPAGDYYVEATFASSGCVGSVAEFTIQLLYSPHHFVPLVLNYTDGRLVVEEKVLNATYTLYFNGEAHPLAPIQVSVLTDDVVWEVGEPGTYYVTSRSNEGCIDESNRITITDVTPPVAEYSLDIDQVLEYCSGDASGIDVVLTGTTAGAFYELVKLDDPDNPEVVQIKKGKGITDGGDVVFNGVEGTHTYSIWVDGSADKFEDASFVVTEYATPSSFLLSRGGAVGSHEITLTGSEEDVWYWLIRNGDIDFEEMPLIGSGEALNFGTVDRPGDYFVMAFGEGGCEAVMEGMANIYQSELVAVNDTLFLSPDDLAGTLDLVENDRFSFIGGLDRFGPGGNLRFSMVQAANSGAETALDEFSGLLSYQKLPSFYGEDFLEYRIENLDVPGRVSGIARVVIMVGNKDFNENQSFLLPNAFSPNGDGINDRLVISGLGETEESTLEVFNRWGTIVYRSQGKQYDNSWDGTSNVGAMVSIGKDLPNGVYFYVYTVKKNVNGSIQTRNYSGYVELRR